MPTEAKKETVESLRAALAASPALVVSEYRGLTVKELAEIRRALRKQDVSYRVVKNRLMKIAADGPTGEALGPLLTGPTAIAFGTDEAATAKAVIDDRLAELSKQLIEAGVTAIDYDDTSTGKRMHFRMLRRTTWMRSWSGTSITHVGCGRLPRSWCRGVGRGTRVGGGRGQLDRREPGRFYRPSSVALRIAARRLLTPSLA